jgi:hypothetical protein
MKGIFQVYTRTQRARTISWKAYSWRGWTEPTIDDTCRSPFHRQLHGPCA